MKLIVGLGNPGKRYERTRHNVGFLVLDALAAAAEESFSFVKECNTELAKSNGVIYCKPQTFMNESGRGVRAVMDYYKIAVQDVVLVYDDKDIPFGTIRLRSEGSSAGHNGVQSVIDHIGLEFTRVRVGIACDEMYRYKETADFVLARFAPAEETRLPLILDASVDAVQQLLKEDALVTGRRDIHVE